MYRVLVTLFLAACLSSALALDWTNTGELTGAVYTVDLAIGPNGNLYAAANVSTPTLDTGRVFVSSDYVNWQETGDLPGNVRALSCVIPLTGGGLLAGGRSDYPGATGPDVYKTTNGSDWSYLSRVTGGTVGTTVLSLLEDNTGVILAGTNVSSMTGRSPHYSTDGGQTWTQGGLPGIFVAYQYCLTQTQNSDIYCGTWGTGGKVTKSTDRGLTWAGTGDMYDAGHVRSLIAAPGNVLYAGTAPKTVPAEPIGRVFRSTDDGTNWQLMQSFATTAMVRSLCRTSDGHLYAGTVPKNMPEDAEVFVSTDDGVTWNSAGKLPNATAIYKLLEVDAGGNRYLYAATGPNGDVFRAPLTPVVTPDVQAVSVDVPVGEISWNETVEPLATLRNNGPGPATFDARFDIYDGLEELYTYTRTGITLAEGAQEQFEFGSWVPDLPGGPFQVKCSTRLAADPAPGNDKAEAEVTVRKLDAEAVSIDAPTGTVNKGEVVQPKATVKNNGSVESFFDVTFSIDDNPPYESTVPTGPLAPGAQVQLTFGDWTPQEVGDFTMKCTTALTGDMYSENDILILPISVQYLDVGVVSITVPQGNYDVGSEITPQATWRNNGTLAASFEAWMILSDPASDARVYAEKVDVTGLAPGQAMLVNTFPAYTLEALGDWTVRCSTYYIPDMDPDNDVLDDGFRVRMVGPSWPAGWHEVASMPLTPSGKLIKDGGWLAVGPDGGTGIGIRGSGIGVRESGFEPLNPVVYAAKGNKTGDFYRYDPFENTWLDCETIPSNEEGKRKPVSKGSAGVTDGERYLYATKGNNTLGFWRYDIAQDTWEALAPVLPGAGKKVKGGTDAVFAPGEGTGCVYLLKGIGTEFYRYNPDNKGWTRLDDVPYGGGRAKYNKGSFLAFDGEEYIYAHQASYNDGQHHYMFRFNVQGDSWEKATLKGIPVYGTEGGRTKKKKSKDGAAGGWYDDKLYAIKGGNTQGFFRYEPDRDTWSESWRAGLGPDTLPMLGTTGKKKRVKNGGDLVYFDYGGFFALKGNKTLELWRYVEGTPLASRPTPLTRDGAQEKGIGNGEWGMGIGPNPLKSGFATLRVQGFKDSRVQGLSVTVFDVAGRSVFSTRSPGHLTTGSLPLDLRSLSAGVYLVRLDAGGWTATQKLVVQR